LRQKVTAHDIQLHADIRNVNKMRLIGQ
jgi:hypothetical protein